MKRMKKLLLLGALSIVALLCLVIAACGPDGGKDGITFRFETNGGPSVADVTVDEGTEYTLPDPDEWEGYVFDGWYYNEDLSGESVSTVTAETDTTFYAKWTKLYTVTLNAGEGGTLSTKSVRVKAGANLLDEIGDYIPTKADHRFGEWLNNSTPVTSSTKMPEEDITLTAHYMVKYTINVYEESLETPGEYDEPYEHEDYAYATNVTFTIRFAPTGFERVQHTGDVVSKTLSDTNAADNVFTAYYNRKTVTVTYNANMGDDSTSNQNGRYGEKIPLPTDVFTRADYLLMGWSDDASGSNPMIVNHEVYNSEEKAEPTEYTLTEDVVLYAVWQRGYTDIFGGVDNIFVIGEDIYLYRLGYLFAGEHVMNNLYSFNAVTADEDADPLLECRIFEDSHKFCYADYEREGDRAYFYDSMTGEIDETTFIQCTDEYNELMYVVANESGTTDTSYGTYYYDDQGLMHLSFTEGALRGNEMVVSVGLNEDYYVSVFIPRDEEDVSYGTLSYIYFDGETASTLPYGVLDMTMDGFGNATLVLNSGELDCYYIKMTPEMLELLGPQLGLGNVETEHTLYLVMTDESMVGMFAIIEVNGKTYYTDYSFGTEGEFNTADRSAALELDGAINAFYYADGGMKTGYYSTTDSYVYDMIVYMASGSEVYQFGIDGSTLVVLEEGYGEYAYFNGDVNSTFILTTPDGETFDLRGILTDGGDFEPFASGTLAYDEATDTYTATIVGEVTLTATPDAIDLQNLVSFKFTTAAVSSSNGSISYVMSWISYTVKDGDANTDVDNKIEYKEKDKDGKDLDGKLVIAKGFGYYTAANSQETYMGVVSVVEYQSIYQYTVLSGEDDPVYVKIDEDAKTFVVLDSTLIGSAYQIGYDGMADSDVTLSMDGLGNATLYNGGVSGKIEGKVTDTGEYTTTNLFLQTGEEVNDKIYRFRSDDNQTDFTFLFTTDNNDNVCFLRNHQYIGTYTTEDGYVLTLDGYCYMASCYNSYEELIAYGMYFIEEVNGKQIVCLVNYFDEDTAVMYFDITSNTATEKTAKLLNEVITGAAVVDNQHRLDETYTFDGDGHVDIYAALAQDAPEGTQPEKIGEGTYTIDNGIYTLTVTYTAEPEKQVKRTGIISSVRFSGSSSYETAFIIYDEEFSYVYINPDDWSIVVLDGAGTAMRVTYNGSVELASYYVLDKDIIYFINSSSTDACIYKLNVTKGDGENADSVVSAEIIRMDFKATGYFTQTLDSLVFGEYGAVTYQNRRISYYTVDDDGKVLMYYYVGDTTLEEGEEANEYGYVVRQFNGEKGFETTVEFDGKSFTKNEGSRITFKRGEQGAAQGNYPITYDYDASGNPVTAPLLELMFTPNGLGSSYETTAYVKLTMSGQTENFPCTLSYVYVSESESHYYLIFPSSGGSINYEIEINYQGTTGSTYTIKNMKMSTALYSYFWYVNSSDIEPEDYGTISLDYVCDVKGQPNDEITLSCEFGGESMFYDHNGNLISFTDAVINIDGEYPNQYYVVEFEIDGYTYGLEFTFMEDEDVQADFFVVMDLYRIETFENVQFGGELYTVDVQTILGSDLSDMQSSIGEHYVSVTKKGEEQSLNFASVNLEDKILLFTNDDYTGFDLSSHLVLTLTYGTSEADIPLIQGVTLTEVHTDNYRGTLDEDSVMVLFNGDDIAIIMVMEQGQPTGYIPVLSTIKNADGTYDITLADGSVYTVTKGSSNTVTIMEKEAPAA